MEDYRKLKLLWWSTCFVLVIAPTECKFVDEDCIADDAKGSCKLLSNCPALFSEVQRSGSPMPLQLRKKLNRLMCGFEADEPIVCCQKSDSGNQGTNNGNPQPTPATSNDDRVLNMITNRNKVPVDVTGHRNFNLLPTNCGLTESDRITGGNRTQLYEMPWMVLIAYDTPRGVKLSCGATLISEWYVLTAAHCVSFLGSRLKLANVVIGEYDIRSNPDCERVEGDLQCAPSVQNITITESIAHPGYSPQNLYDDIAILRMSRAADFTLDSQKPVCLPVTPELQTESLVGLKTIAAGWGATEDGLQSPVLLSVDLPVISNEDCEKVFRSSIKDTQLCAGGVEGKDSCAGDSGGPLIYPGKVGAYGVRQVQRGIVSFGSKRCGVVGFPGVYTNIAYYMDWILDNMHE